MHVLYVYIIPYRHIYSYVSLFFMVLFATLNTGYYLFLFRNEHCFSSTCSFGSLLVFYLNWGFYLASWPISRIRAVSVYNVIWILRLGMNVQVHIILNTQNACVWCVRSLRNMMPFLFVCFRNFFNGMCPANIICCCTWSMSAPNRQITTGNSLHFRIKYAYYKIHWLSKYV